MCRVSVERARGTPRGSDVWRGSGRGGDLPPPPPRRPRRDARFVLTYFFKVPLILLYIISQFRGDNNYCFLLKDIKIKYFLF